MVAISEMLTTLTLEHRDHPLIREIINNDLLFLLVHFTNTFNPSETETAVFPSSSLLNQHIRILYLKVNDQKATKLKMVALWLDDQIYPFLGEQNSQNYECRLALKYDELLDYGKPAIAIVRYDALKAGIFISGYLHPGQWHEFFSSFT